MHICTCTCDIPLCQFSVFSYLSAEVNHLEYNGVTDLVVFLVIFPGPLLQELLPLVLFSFK